MILEPNEGINGEESYNSRNSLLECGAVLMV
jgi:hypothetical protein